jgi:transcriptional regulator with XRE-family HTH domain
MTQSAPDNPPPFGRLLRFWRNTFSLSQEALSAAVGVSARHLSFLENGRSNPGRQLVLDLAQVFDIGHRDTNNMLVAAGFHPLDSGQVNGREPGFLDKSLRLTLKAMDPVPVCIMDPCGAIKLVNRGWIYFQQRYNTAFMSGDCYNSYHLYFSGEGLRPLLHDWEDIACALLVNLQQEVLLTEDTGAQQVLDELLAYPGIPDNWRQRGAAVAFNHNFRFAFGGNMEESHTIIAVNNTIGVTPYVSQPRLIVNSLHPLDDSLLPNAQQLAQVPDHPLLADY